jgi:hypothetical protein
MHHALWHHESLPGCKRDHLSRRHTIRLRLEVDEKASFHHEEHLVFHIGASLRGGFVARVSEKRR